MVERDPLASERASNTKRRILELLKSSGEATAPMLAASLEISDVAVRQHLQDLKSKGLVEEQVDGACDSDPDGARSRGRPPTRWRTTALTTGLFPDRHGDLAVSLLDAMRRSLGEEAVKRMLEARAERQRETYHTLLGRERSLHARLRTLARQRTEEGYLAEVRAEADGTFLLIEHHCPICTAATVCQGLCHQELAVFRSVLGPAEVERESHLLSGGDRCVYRVRPAESAPKK
ncbi:MAG: transcriptional regulator [Candidatus Eisenbacteria bacterium]|uniref:Transcriptional regulator n=1 Tax=Eiseniibacteriota bacterium TaxID=2212470 RepID=A0A956LXT9_UNCEI|nr:transcriptional regulator [Candidatus Eisenbacteria bacterium]